MEHVRRDFIPAAGRHWALPFYDPMVKAIGGDRARRALLHHAALAPGQRVLDLGCGTGTLAVLVKKLNPGAEVVGLDPDPKALARAAHKAARAGVEVRFHEGFADALPYPDASFDRVLSSFVYHHLEGGEKDAMFREVGRVLQPGGFLCLLDIAGPEPGTSALARRLHGNHLLEGNTAARVVTALAAAGFEDARRVGRASMMFGLVGCSIFQASRGAARSTR